MANPIRNAVKTKLSCKRCGYQWTPRGHVAPQNIRCCPQCKSRGWREEKTTFETHTTHDSWFVGKSSEDVRFVKELEKRSMSQWSENELRRYNKITGQENQ